jgi:hypothetical protein
LFFCACNVVAIAIRKWVAALSGLFAMQIFNTSNMGLSNFNSFATMGEKWWLP